jgi:hypothetical protein
MDGACSTHRREEKCIQVSVGKPERKKPLGGLRHRWEEDNIRIDIREIRTEGVDWIHLAQNRDQ